MIIFTKASVSWLVLFSWGNGGGGMYPVMKVEQRHRFSSSFSDFITRYTAVSSTNKQTQIAEYYALDPGDVLTFAGGQADEGQITCITSIRQKIGGKQSLKCVGKNHKRINIIN